MAVLDLRDLPDFTVNPYPYYAKLRAEGPVHIVRTDEMERIWLVVGYEEARAALADQRLGKDWRTTGRWEASEAVLSANMLELDAPHHTRLRRLVVREFTPGGSRRCARASPRSPADCSTRWCPGAPPTWSMRSPSRCR